MHPELLNNSLFLRYYAKWQQDPASLTFASIAEFFLRYHLIDDAFKVCREGLNHHPTFISGRFVLAKIQAARGNVEEALLEIKRILADQPGHQGALVLFTKLEEEEARAAKRGEEAVRESAGVIPPAWKTVTMARIFAAQGHVERARDIYEIILQDDPENQLARSGLSEILRQAECA